MTIQLTAEEMNANKIIVIARHDGADSTGCASIITGGSSDGATSFSPEAMTSICKAVNEGYTVVSKATDESGYNYYGLTNPQNKWWLIIQEKTNFTSIGYKMARENRQTYADGWTNRATLNYSDVFPL